MAVFPPTTQTVFSGLFGPCGVLATSLAGHSVRTEVLGNPHVCTATIVTLLVTLNGDIHKCSAPAASAGAIIVAIHRGSPVGGETSVREMIEIPVHIALARVRLTHRRSVCLRWERLLGHLSDLETFAKRFLVIGVVVRRSCDHLVPPKSCGLLSVCSLSIRSRNPSPGFGMEHVIEPVDIVPDGVGSAHQVAKFFR